MVINLRFWRHVLSIIEILNQCTWTNEVWYSKKSTDIPTSFISINILFDKAFKYGDGAKFLGYVGASLYRILPVCARSYLSKFELSGSNLLQHC
jgi:hypothetical protein